MRSPCVDVHSADWHRLQQSAAFWDVNPTTLNPQRHAAWIIARILEFGTWDEWLALFRCYPASTIQHALAQRGVPDHIRRFWKPYFQDEEPLVCTEPVRSLTHEAPLSLLEQAVHICDAITHRGTRQDFLDLYALVLHGLSLTDVFNTVNSSPSSCHLANLLRNLGYFVDANQASEPLLQRSEAKPELYQTIKQSIYAYLRHTLPCDKTKHGI